MTNPTHAVYGTPPADLVQLERGALQCSPQVPGATVLADLADASLATLNIAAPASTLERQHVIAHGLRALAPGGVLTVVAPNDKGGTRLAGELESFGCPVEASHKRHHRIARVIKPALAPEQQANIAEAIHEGAPRIIPGLGLWSQPGLFSWDRIDPGSRLLIDHLPPLQGQGADLGCGIGVLAHGVLRSASVTALTLVDLDQRALACCERNVADARVTRLWADVRTGKTLPIGLDFVVMNPPFHDGGAEDRALGLAFIQRAAGLLKPGGSLWLTANRHLPYEATLNAHFATVTQVAQAAGYKIYHAETNRTPARRSTPVRQKRVTL